jgi:hypothetical protein
VGADFVDRNLHRLADGRSLVRSGRDCLEQLERRLIVVEAARDSLRDLLSLLAGGTLAFEPVPHASQLVFRGPRCAARRP